MFSVAIDVSRVVACVMDKKFAELKKIFDNSIEEVSAEMFAAGVISDGVKSKQSAEVIISNFHSGFVFMNTFSEAQQHCAVFFSVLEKLGGPFRIAGNSIKQDIKKAMNAKAWC